jgi:hypothetical protein
LHGRQFDFNCRDNTDNTAFPFQESKPDST